MIEISTPDLRRQTILIIDDTPINLTVLAESLEGRGFRVAIAQDGKEGLQRAEFAQPGLILLDVMLPGLDGFEVCRRLKANVRTRDIPVIFMTALSGCEDKVNGFAVGGIDYVTKPLQMDEMVARVDTHLKLYASQRLVAAQNAQLQQYQESLERLVAERTADLHESNRQLREEIGERKCMEELLHTREREFRTLVENSPDTIARYDRECRRVYANPRLVTDMGGDMSLVLGTTALDFPGGPFAQEYQQKMREVLERGEKRNFELR